MNNHVLLTNGDIVDVENGEVKRGTIEIKNGIIHQIYEENADFRQMLSRLI